MTATATATATVTAPPVLVLKLKQTPKITWTEDTVDNEGLGRKSSKRCCIFHKVKKFDESDSDESVEEKDGDGDGENKGSGGGKVPAPHLRHHA
jgi:protein phosphatase 1 regulatory subunit 11